MLNIVTALAEEARPIIDSFGLRRIGMYHAFPVYSSDDMRLIVSGIGNVNAATATGFLAAIDSDPVQSAWLNVGIAGARETTLGSAVLANKITLADTGKLFYPALLFDCDFQSAPLVSVNIPVHDYESNTMYDMEAAGFYQAAMRFSTVELIHSCKIISDNEGTPLAAFEKNTASDLIAGQLDFIATIAGNLVTMADELQENRDALQLQRQVIGKVHFTKTQSSQLLNLLNRWLALTGETPAFLQKIEGNVSAKILLSRLTAELDTLPVVIEPGGL